MRLVPALARLAFGFCAAALVLALLAGLGTRFGVWNYHTGVYAIFPFSAATGTVALACGLVWAVLAMTHSDYEAALAGWIALAGSLLLLAFPLYDYYALKTLPPIHDITTDIANPPQFRALLASRRAGDNKPEYDGSRLVTFDGKTKTAAEWQRKDYTDIHTLQLLTPPANLFKRALKGAHMMGWTVVSQSPEEGRIEAYDRTFLFGTASDIVIRIRPSGAGAKLDVRAQSRIGDSDIGRNAGLLRVYLKTVARRT